MNAESRSNDAAAYYKDSALGPETYDRIYAQPFREALGFYIACARKYGGPILEIGCGTGLITWALAEDGQQVVGIDLSERMLDIARAKGDRHDPSTVERVAFQRADMVDFRLGNRFKTAMIPGRSFQHLLTPAEQRTALTSIHDHLDPGGTLIMNQFDPKFDFCMPDAEPPVTLDEIVDPETGQTIRRVFLSRITDPLTQTFKEEMLLQVLDENGHSVAEEKTHWSLRWTYAQEMRYIFELTGFEVEQLYSDYDYGYPAYAKEQIWICRKL